MVHERFYSQSGCFFGRRCVACGEIIDETILENRRSNEGTMGQKHKEHKDVNSVPPSFQDSRNNCYCPTCQ